MFYLIWSLLNIILGLGFIGICFRAAKLIREHLGLVASIIFITGLLSFAGNQSRIQGSKDQVKKWTFTSRNGVIANTIKYSRFTVDTTLTLTIDVGIQYGRDTSFLKLVPIEASSGLTGFISGYRWEPDLIAAYPTSTAGKVKYEVYGSLNWNLFGVTLYTQPKRYSGFVDLKSGKN